MPQRRTLPLAAAAGFLVSICGLFCRIRYGTFITFPVAFFQDGLALLDAFGLFLRLHPVAALDTAIMLGQTPVRTITLLVDNTLLLIFRR